MKLSNCFLELGGNMGDTKSILNLALEAIDSRLGKIIKKSAIYKTEPWGFTEQGDFLNQVIGIETCLLPHDLLYVVNKIEEDFHRVRIVSNQFAPRTLDIDILFYDDDVINDKDLIIPHCRIHERNFVLVPLNEIAPDFIHPIYKKSIKELLEICKDYSKVEIYSED